MKKSQRLNIDMFLSLCGIMQFVLGCYILCTERSFDGAILGMVGAFIVALILPNLLQEIKDLWKSEE